ncbi:MAG: type II secretion system F family protein [Spirochaetia bacterium]
MSLLADFTGMMSVFEKSGMGVSESLEAALLTASKGPLFRRIGSIRNRLLEGYSFTESAVPVFPGCDSFTRFCFQSAETEGPEGGYFSMIKERMDRRSRISSALFWALLYPAGVTLFTFAGIFLLGSEFLPRLLRHYPAENLELILLVERRITAMITAGAGVMLFLFIFTAVLVLERRFRFLGPRVYAVFRRIPVAGKIHCYAVYERFCGSLAKLRLAGYSIPQSLRIVSHFVDDPAFALEIREGIVRMEKGEDPAEIFSRASVLNPFFVRWFSLECRSRNRPGEAFTVLTQYYRTRLDGLLTGVTKGAEPAAVVAAGGIILFTVLGCVLPLITMMIF